MKVWKKFIECSCHTEGIMVSQVFDDQIELAFFQHYPGTSERKVPFWERVRLLITGEEPWKDMVTLNKETAKELMNELKLFICSAEPNEKTKEITEGDRGDIESHLPSLRPE